MTDDVIASDKSLSEEQRADLRALLELMVPASDEYAVPSAADDRIFEDIESEAAKILSAFQRSLSALNATSQRLFSERFSELNAVEREQVAEQFRTEHQYVGVLVSTAMQCYYRDDRVMTSLGMEPRAPAPKGFEVEQGDWSLLDPVQARGKLYRDA